jgi:hypothetical protein
LVVAIMAYHSLVSPEATGVFLSDRLTTSDDSIRL